VSHREYMIVLAHTHVCGMCRQRLLEDLTAAVSGRSLSEEERTLLASLKFEHYLTPDTLARAASVTAEELDAFRDEAVVRLRHL
jgi:hypothetical protein